MKHLCTILATVLAAAFSASAKTFDWPIGSPAAKAETFTAYHGETVRFNLQFGGSMTNLAPVAIYYQTNGMGKAEWFGPVPGTVFHPTNDCGAASYRFFIRCTDGDGINYTANGSLRMLDSPGFVPNALPLPVQTLDFAQIEVLNAPWIEEHQPLTNYYTRAETDASVADATNNIPQPTRTSQLVNDGDGTNSFATVADIVLEPVYSDNPDFTDWEVFPVSDSYDPVGFPEYWNGEWFMYVYYPAWYGNYEAYGNTTDPNALYVEFVCDDIAPGLVVCTAKRSRIDIKGWTIGGNTNAVMQPAGDYAARAELQRVETNVVPRAARDATNYVDSATHLTPIWEDAPPGTVDKHGMPVLGWFRGYKLGSQSTKILAATNYVGDVARDVATNAAKIAAMPGVVTNIVRDLSLGGIWDSQLEVWWTPRMRNGSLTYEATTNVNLNAEN